MFVFTIEKIMFVFTIEKIMTTLVVTKSITRHTTGGEVATQGNKPCLIFSMCVHTTYICVLVLSQ